MKRHWLVFAVLTVACARPVHAQTPWPVSLEFMAGRSFGHSAENLEYRGGRKGLYAEIILGGRLHAADRAGAFVAVHGSTNFTNWTVDDSCLLADGGGCVPWFPGVNGVSALAGWESRSTAVRAMVGIGKFSYFSTDGTGYSARLDLAWPGELHLAPVATVSGLWLPDYEGDRLSYLNLGIGLRAR